MEKKHWHPAFCSATEWELKENKKELRYEPEHQLSREPLRVDLLIIKKQENAIIQNEIGKIFRRYNLIEFKGAGDALNIDVFHKVIGYAHRYKSTGAHVDEIPADEITVTIIREAYPRKLFQQLKQYKIVVEERYPGVFYLIGDNLFPMQIVVTKLLDRKHAGLKILSNKASEPDVRQFLREAKVASDEDDLRNIDAILQVSVSANRRLYDRVRGNRNMCEALKELMKDEIAEWREESRIEGLSQGLSQGRKEGLSQGLSQGFSQGMEEGLIKALRELMNNMKWTAEQAMKAIGIPETDQDKYISML